MILFLYILVFGLFGAVSKLISISIQHKKRIETLESFCIRNVFHDISQEMTATFLGGKNNEDFVE